MVTSTPEPDERVKTVTFDDANIDVELMDGRHVVTPLSWYPRLEAATPEQRLKWDPCGGGFGLHWEELDEDLSTEGMLLGQRAPGGR